MKRILSRFLLVTALFLSGLAPALAQNVGATVITLPAVKATYTALITGLTPAASATDFVTITAPSTLTKLIRVNEIACDGTSTSASTPTIFLALRSAVDTGGTSAAVTAVANDTSDAAATAAVLSYTANPTLGTSIGNIRRGVMSLAATGGAGTPYVFSPGPITGGQPLTSSKPWTLRANQVLAINASGVSFAAGTSLNCRIVWTEG